MGSPVDEFGRFEDEGPRTQVTLPDSFWLGRVPVTQGQWKALIGTDLVEQARLMLADGTNYPLAGEQQPIHRALGVTADSDPTAQIGILGDDLPIYYVSWEEATEFCRRLTERERVAKRLPAGYEYRLPTEAEWEYACRAGTGEATYAGKVDFIGENNAPTLDSIAWYAGNSCANYQGKGWSTAHWPERQYVGSTAGPRPVGGKQPNAWGLYDMLGNVDQWCSNWYASKLPGGKATDPQGPKTGSRQVARGGAWDSSPRFVRAAFRFWGLPGFRYVVVGFRVALAPDARSQAFAVLKSEFPKPPSAFFRSSRTADAASPSAGELLNQNNSRHIRELYSKYQREVSGITLGTLPQTCRNLGADLAEDISNERQILATFSPVKVSTQEQYFVARACLDWLEDQLKPWLDRASSLIPFAAANE